MAKRNRTIADDHTLIIDRSENLPNRADRPWYYLNPISETEAQALIKGVVPDRVRRTLLELTLIDSQNPR